MLMYWSDNHWRH